MLTFEVT